MEIAEARTNGVLGYYPPNLCAFVTAILISYRSLINSITARAIEQSFMSESSVVYHSLVYLKHCMIVEHFNAYKHDCILPDHASLGSSKTFISRRVPRWLRVATRLIMTARESRDYLYLPDVRCIEDLNLSKVDKYNKETRRYGTICKLKKCVRSKSDWFFSGFFDKLSFLVTQSEKKESHLLVEYQSCFDVLKLGVYSKRSIQSISRGSAFTEDGDFDVFIPEIGGRMFKLGISITDNEDFHDVLNKPINLGYGPEIDNCGYHIQIFFGRGNTADVSDSDNSDDLIFAPKLGLGHSKRTTKSDSSNIDTKQKYGKGHDILKSMQSKASSSKQTQLLSESTTTVIENPNPPPEEIKIDDDVSPKVKEDIIEDIEDMQLIDYNDNDVDVDYNRDICWLYNSYSHIINSSFSEEQSLYLFITTIKHFEVRRYTRREIESPFRLYDFVQSNILDNVFPKLSNDSNTKKKFKNK